MKKSPAPQAGAVLDEERMDILRELGQVAGEDLLTLLVASYLQEVPERLAALDRAVGAGDLMEARDLAHSFKGVSANLGASSLVSLLHAFERALDDGEAAAPLLPGLAAEVARTAEALRMATAATSTR